MIQQVKTFAESTSIHNVPAYNKAWKAAPRWMGVGHRVLWMGFGVLLYRAFEHDHAAVMWTLEWVRDSLKDIGGLAGVAALIGVLIRKRKGNGNGKR